MTASDKNHTGQRTRNIAVIAGSGLEGVGDRFRVMKTAAFDEIEGLGACTVAGHAGKVNFCESDEREFFLVLGRRHVYEGGRYGMGRLIQWLAERGASGLVVISAAGGLNRSFPPGGLVSADGIIDLQNFRLLQKELRPVPRSLEGAAQAGVAATERGYGLAGTAPSPRLSAAVREAAVLAGVELARGTLACCAGPAYETPSEVVYLKRLGADLATMSAAPEVFFARRTGLEVAVIGAVTNYATGIGSARVEHAAVLEKAAAMCDPLSRIIAKLIAII